jgi:phospholipid/cholesterol/gamma-HCH transport system substrate-binding protein
MRIDKHYLFPKTRFNPDLRCSEQYVGLDAGGDTNNLKDGGEIKLTQSAMVLEKLIGQFLYGKASEGATNNK